MSCAHLLKGGTVARDCHIPAVGKQGRHAVLEADLGSHLEQQGFGSHGSHQLDPHGQAVTG